MKTLFIGLAAFFLLFASVEAQVLTRSLSVGSRGDDVKMLQSYLALDTSIYPERLVTGYFGQLTKAAVTRFQRANSISPIGIVGPLTRAALASKMQIPTLATASPAPIQSTTSNSQNVCNMALINADGYDSARVISKEACELLNSLYAKGLISGNIGDSYENRDALHVNLCDGWTPNPECPMAHRLFPQHAWLLGGPTGRATGVRTGVTVGQASHAGESDGYVKHSIPYSMYKSQSGATSLYNQYTHNNLYIYPAITEGTQDNIANTPYVISSEGASGSDLPFVRLAFAGLAAFNPEVKKSLMNGPLLIPTLQMIIRHSHKTVATEADYLTTVAHDNTSRAHYLVNGVPHPNYDSLKLVRLASELTADDVPPLVQLKILNEDFDRGEVLFNTPGAIARSINQNAPARSIKVSAKESKNLAGLTTGHVYEWRVLNSDPAKVRIIPDPTDTSSATLEFTAGNVTERLDVGVFARKPDGKYYSVPGFITVYVHP